MFSLYSYFDCSVKLDDFNLILLIFRSSMVMSVGVPFMVYISQLIRFARAYEHVSDFFSRNKFFTAKLIKEDYRYHKFGQAFSKFYRRHFEFIE